MSPQWRNRCCCQRVRFLSPKKASGFRNDISGISSRSRPFANADELIRELKKYIQEYEKSADVFPIVYPLTGDATKHARRIQRNRPDRDDPFPNPSTGVYLLVERMQNMKDFK